MTKDRIVINKLKELLVLCTKEDKDKLLAFIDGQIFSKKLQNKCP